MGIIVAEKDIPTKQNLFGQFFTDNDTASFCIGHTPIFTKYVVEPSCGKGVFLDKIRLKAPQATILAIEIDEGVATQYTGFEKIIVKNFYDFNYLFSEPVCFIGNPPYHSPAYSLSERPQFVKSLMKKYGITNMREESVIFFVYTFDLIVKSKVKGYINYIMPRSVFDNNSKAYLSFRKFLRTNLRLVQVWTLDKCFEGVNRDLVYVGFETGAEESEYLHDGILQKISVFYNKLDYIPFQSIFKKTNLGSVPCESIFLSIHDEPIEHFTNRIYGLFSSDANEENVLLHLVYNGNFHLTSLKKENNKSKVAVILKYINEIKSLPGYNIELFKDISNYKIIRNRHDDRFYFRHHFLKKGSFVYELNRNPCPSFYFPGNPNKGSTDYFGFCEYDVNRNSSPGANRTVPLSGIEDNLHDDFKNWWRQNCDLDFSLIFKYIIYISKSEWYKNLKQNCQRFYFGIPKDFDKGFLEQLK